MNSVLYNILNLFYRCIHTDKKPIFIVGTGRSGTTWIGNTFKQSPGVLYYNEPCNPTIGSGGQYSDWFRYVSPDSECDFFESRLTPAFNGLISDGKTWLRDRAIRRFFPDFRIVVKEVAALMSLEWVCKKYNPFVLIVVRHPCAVVLSEIKKKTQVENAINEITSQEMLVENNFTTYLSLMKKVSDSIEVYSTIWAVRYRLIANLLAKHPKWEIISYEVLCKDPVNCYRLLFDKFGLHWNNNVKKFILKTTTEYKPGTHSISRVTSKQVDKWKTEMPEEDILKVQDVVSAFDLPFYNSKKDWEV